MGKPPPRSTRPCGRTLSGNEVMFRLSIRQRKELIVRGSRVPLAIPHPRYELTDVLQYARDHIDVPPNWVRSAEVIELTVMPRVGRLIELDNLTTVLGQILHNQSDDPPAHITFQVVAIVASVCANKPRHQHKTQWVAKWDPKQIRFFGDED